MPDGGTLAIETANRWLDGPGARERDMPPGQYVSLCVSDNGVGILPEVAACAFDPFFITKPLGEGEAADGATALHVLQSNPTSI